MTDFNKYCAKSTHQSANDNAAKSANLPVSLATQRDKPSLQQNKTSADFLSQLIAERARLATQRPKRRAPVSLATKAYNTARNIVIKRMPAGFTYNSNI